MFPSVQQFTLDLTTLYFHGATNRLSQEYLTHLTGIYAKLYSQEFPDRLPPEQQRTERFSLKVKYAAKAYHLFLKASAQSLVGFTEAAPTALLERPKSDSFLIEKKNTVEQLIGDAQSPIAFRAMGTPFRNPDLITAGLFGLSYEPIPIGDVFVQGIIVPGLIGTPLLSYALQLSFVPTSPAPFEIPVESRFKHQWVISPSGGGKTTLLESQIIRDLDEVARGECSVVVIDSQAVPGEKSLIPNIAGLKLFAPGQPLDGKLVLLEPDPEYPLALNIFDRSLTDTGGMSRRDRNMHDASSAEMIQFCLSTMTDQQEDLFSYVVQFLMVIPGATIDTLRKILMPNGLDEYRIYLDGMDPTVQDFFKTLYDGPGFKVTREAVLRRVMGMLSNATFRHMFQSKTNKFNMLKELSEPKVILINTDMAYLKRASCELFGRFFIAQLLQAVEVRGDGLPVFCYIDEMHDYLSDDKNLEFLNDKARKRNVGMIYAHQRLSNIKSEGVKDSLCNVDIQFAGGNRTDAKLLADLIHATPEQIGAMPVGNFMAYVQRHTPAAVQVEVTELMPTMPRMTQAEMLHVKEQMRKRYARPLHEAEAPILPLATPTITAPVPSDTNDEADAKPWKKP